MTFSYPVVITPKEKGFLAEMPDLAGCRAEGGTLEDALQEVREEAEEWIRIEMTEFEGDLPYASHPEDLLLQEGQFVRIALVPFKLLPDND